MKRFIKYVKLFIGLCIGTIMIPLLLIGALGLLLYCTLPYFGIVQDSDDDVYLSGPSIGMSK